MNTIVQVSDLNGDSRSAVLPFVPLSNFAEIGNKRNINETVKM